MFERRKKRPIAARGYWSLSVSVHSVAVEVGLPKVFVAHHSAEFIGVEDGATNGPSSSQAR